jgi:glycosyltransferase involved in cell wall biosynthesis
MIINVCSPTFDIASSYGRVARELAVGLSALGAEVNPFGGDADTSRPIKPVMGGIFLGYPTSHSEYGGMVNAGPKLAITMFESTKLPEGWAEALNQCEAVIVPSTWTKQVFEACGVTVPVHVVPLGISTAFQTITKRETSEPFAFLATADGGRRKNWNAVAFAFQTVYGDDTRFKRILKTRGMPYGISNPNIELLEGDYDDAQMAELYRRCHVMLFPSSGEGFGLPPREFASTGGVAVATNWSGLADDLPQWGVPLPYSRLIDAWKGNKKGWHGRMGQWAEPDQKAMEVLIRHLPQYYEAYRDFALRAAGFVQTHYRWDTFASRVYSIWKETSEAYYARNRRGTHTLTA